MASSPDRVLEGRSALVTGGSRGIGLAIARSFVEAGARVMITSRNATSCEEAARALGPAADFEAGHVARPADVERVVEATLARLGRIDVLVNNAATNPYFGPVIEIDEGAYDKTFEVNVKGYFLMSQHAARMMVDQGGGSIVNVASIAGIAPPPFQAVYGMTKSAVIGMTKAFAKELAGAKVRVNAICPGVIETKFASVLIETPEIYEHFVSRTPMGRHGQPEEIAGLAVYLASDASSYTTGGIFTVDGGYSA